jgi:hypothetical protein
MEIKLPFNEIKVSDNIFIREFTQDTDSEELKWHRDHEDRIIESLEETDWMIQLDNELPKSIKGKVFIPMGVYHRLIKGNGDLKIKLTKLI